MKFRVTVCVLACGAGLAACGETTRGPQGSDSISGSSGTGGSAAAMAGATAGGKANGGSNTSGGSNAVGGRNDVGGKAGASNVPEDDRPERPEWDPPFPVGKPGWRDSDELLCEHQQGQQDAFDVWADERGAFAVLSTACNVLAGVRCGKQGLSLQHNDGTGWKLLYALPPGEYMMGSNGSLLLTGFESGPLLLSGYLEGVTGVWQVDASGEVSLSAQLAVGRPFVVESDLAYALGQDALYRFTAGEWSWFLDLPSPAQALWADQELIVIVGSDQAVYTSRNQAPFVALEGAPAGHYSAVWAFGAQDIWAGNQAGQLAHYDGQGWETVPTGSEDASGSGIEQIWGSSDGQLFFRTRTEFGRWNGSGVELLLTPPQGSEPSVPRVTTSGLWGLSSKEVFLAIADRKYRDYQCGAQFMLWFDGEELHSF